MSESEIRAILPNNNNNLHAIVYMGFQAYIDDDGLPYDFEIQKIPIVAWVIIESDNGFASMPVLASGQRLDDDDLWILWDSSTETWVVYFGQGKGEDSLCQALITEAQENREWVLNKQAEGKIEKPKLGKVSPIRRPNKH